MIDILQKILHSIYFMCLFFWMFVLTGTNLVSSKNYTAISVPKSSEHVAAEIHPHKQLVLE